MKKKEMPVCRTQLTNLVSAVVKRVKTKKEQTAQSVTEGVKDNGKSSNTQAAN